jgi:hypothetical protein
VTHEGDKGVGSPHSQLDCPVAFPEDGIRGQGKAVGHRDAADGFAILVRLLSEAKCQNAASRRPSPLRNCQRVLLSAITTGSSSPISSRRYGRFRVSNFAQPACSHASKVQVL